MIDVADDHPAPDRSLDLNVFNEGPLEERAYSLYYDPSGTGDREASGGITYHSLGVATSLRYQDLIDAWDPELCAFNEDAIPSGADRYQAWTFIDGTLTIESLDPGVATTGRFDAIAEDGEGNPAGTASGTFDATFCEAEGDLNLVVF